MAFYQSRKEIMSSIRGKGNKTTELKLLALLKANKITGWRRHFAILGKPDFAFPREKLAVFVDGCFWHGCPRCYQQPRENTKFWKNKVSVNKARDKRVSRKLRGEGWSVCRVWECALKNSPSSAVKKIQRMLAARDLLYY